MNELIEKAKKIKMVFFDIDDTLRDKNTGQIPKSAMLAFECLHQKHILTGIATGRNFLGIVPEILELNPDFFVTMNGAYVENSNKEVIYKRPFPDSLVRKTINWLIMEKSDFAFFGSHDGRINSSNPFTKELFGPFFPHDLTEDITFYKNHEIYQLTAASNHEEQYTVPRSLEGKIRKVPGYKNLSDIVLTNNSKAVGVGQVLRNLKFTRENLMSFGDGLNDCELADFAGLSVAMKVSEPKLLNLADYVATDLQNDGIYKALKSLEIL